MRPFRLSAIVSLVVLIVAAARILVHGATAPSPADAFFDDSQVHSIYLTINSRDWLSLQEHVLENTYYPSDFKWNTEVVRNIGIRSRGTGSRYGAKPGLRVDFDRYTSKQEFLGLKSVILRNQTQDPSNMHERISMLLFQRLGVRAPREAFTRLYINNVYSGLYSIVESVDKAFLLRTLGEDDGYLYKYDYNVGDAPYYFEDRGTNPAAYVPSPFKPETHESDPRSDRIVDFVRIVNDSDPQAAFRIRVDPYVQWDNFIKHIAIENCVADQDGYNGDYGMNNFYWYNWTNTNLFTWIPWDKSEAFKAGPFLPIFHNITDVPAPIRNRLTGRALNSDDLRTLYLDTLLACAKSASALDPEAPGDTRGWMEREIQREYAQIRDLVYSDNQKPFTNEQFEQEVETLRTFARERPKFVEAEVAKARQ
jgi:spore coat protein CotH